MQEGSRKIREGMGHKSNDWEATIRDKKEITMKKQRTK